MDVMSLATPKEQKRDTRSVHNADLSAHAKAWLRKLRTISQPPPSPKKFRFSMIQYKA